jgi:hypothetical protein
MVAQQKGLNVFAMDSIPRISRAQTFDALSSMASIAGYKAVGMSPRPANQLSLFPFFLSFISLLFVFVLWLTKEMLDERSACREPLWSVLHWTDHCCRKGFTALPRLTVRLLDVSYKRTPPPLQVPPAKVLVIGAGVAGLSAVATARSMGAIVRAFDTRPAAREQVHHHQLPSLFVPFDVHLILSGAIARRRVS